MNNFGRVINQIVRDRKNLWLRLVLGSFLVITAATLIARLVQWKLDLQLQSNDQSILASRGSDPEIARIPLSEAKDAFDNQEAVFLDVRSSESYKADHIPGAVNISLTEILSRYQEIDPARWIILYCT
jgi:3-mercaptopyruvate sulfurtransferase SseA